MYETFELFTCTNLLHLIIFAVILCNIMEIESIFKRNQGFIKAKELKKRNLYYQLKKLIDLGLVEKIKPGLYKHIEIAKLNDWFEVAKIVPEGIFCLRSACFYYGLSTDIPNEYQVAIEHTRKISLPDYPAIKLFYWKEQSLDTGINIVHEKKHEFKIYDVEKTVCDILRYRNKIDSETLNQVIKNYLSRKDKNIDLLIKYAQLFGVDKKMNEYINLLLG